MNTQSAHPRASKELPSGSPLTLTRPIVIGAGIGGLSTALRLAAIGARPLVLERSDAVGGKAHQVHLTSRDERGELRDYSVDGGPTVMTMLPVFQELFQRAGARLEERVKLSPARVLARHFWPDGSQFDLPASMEEAAEAVRAFSGDREAEGFIRYHRYTETIYESVKDIFIYAPKPSPLKMLGQLGFSIIPRLLRADIHRVMWSALQRYFQDERLIQLFGRYATYTGNNPFLTPATFNLIASVEQRGVWRVEGGIKALASAMRDLITQRGGEVITGAEVSEITMAGSKVSGVRLADGQELQSEIVIFNGDTQAIAGGHLGLGVRRAVKSYAPSERSLSALTLCAVADAPEAPLIHHNVWFSADYRQEFRELEAGRLPQDPTIYLCAQDRGDEVTPRADDISGPTSTLCPPERLFALVNAPAQSDTTPLPAEELTQCQSTVIKTLDMLNISLRSEAQRWTSPREWDAMFPHTGGAIYGMAARHWSSNLKRMGAKSKVKGLYLTGGSAHPGAGVPMAAISGGIAADQVMRDCGLTET